MADATPRRKMSVLHAAGWTGYFSVLAGVAAVCLVLVFWAGGSVIGTLIALAAALILLTIAFFSIRASREKGNDPTLQRRVRRLRRARYRNAYPPTDGGGARRERHS
jgi:membrane protein implicated in regulation of membrane protease activity